MSEAVFKETAAELRTEAVPLAHLSLELGHLYLEDFEAGPERLAGHFAEVRIWADAVRASVARRTRRPRISTCFLVDDYFTRFSAPADLIPMVLREAEKAGLVIDYLARESACAIADRVELAESVMHRLVESPPPGSCGFRPPVSQTGWLANGRRSPTMPAAALGGRAKGWEPPRETAARDHSIFMDVELWSEKDGRRLWSCPFLAAVWQLARLGLLRHLGLPVLTWTQWQGADFPHDWDRLPPLIKLTGTDAAFSAYRTCTLMSNRFLAVEDAVRLILDQVDVDAGALEQVARRSAAEGMPVPDAIAQRAAYVFYEEPLR
ncbi:SCO2522 family protein [Streptomyces thermospinosisporus]|uniref:SCO2522 family protein n=1 Tax=Streptomyces thermospinosisporus TaxID=161482 RepID=A0ABN1Z446_9ACTN